MLNYPDKKIRSLITSLLAYVAKVYARKMQSHDQWPLVV